MRQTKVFLLFLKSFLPDIQVDRGLERKAVMRLQLHLGGCCASTRVRRQIVWTALIIDVICGLLHRRWRRWWLLQVRYGRGRRDMLRGYGRGARKGGAIYDCIVVIHGGGTKIVRGGRRKEEETETELRVMDGDQLVSFVHKVQKLFSFRKMHQFYARQVGP
jgi:hypothetical protein